MNDANPTPDPAQTVKRRRRKAPENGLDAEVQAIQLCTRALEPIKNDAPAIERVLAYVKDRLQIEG